MVEVQAVLLLGPVQVRSQVTPTRPLPRREKALLARLAIDIGRVVSTDRLIEDLWGGLPPPSAPNALHVYISHLRRLLGPEAIRRSGAGYELVSGPCEVDARTVERLLRDAAQQLMSGHADGAVAALDEALASWRGEPLSDLTDFEFARIAATSFHDLRGTVVQQLSEALLERGEHDRVVAEAGPCLNEFPFREQLRAAVMTALYRQGRAVEALKLYTEARYLMREDLGLDPGPGLQALQKAILLDDPSLMRAATRYQVATEGIKRNAKDASTQIPKFHLPVQPTSLLGRMAEVAEVSAHILHKHRRLVTLTGVGGAGKTRLAMEVAENAVEDFAGCVYFVSLASVDDARMVIPSIAQTLGAKEGNGRDAHRVICELLSGRRALLVVDNFEQVVSAAPAMADLLSACPDLHLLVTSRQSLRLPGEQTFAVRPLAVPDDDAIEKSELATLCGYDAVQLFVERARSVDQSFSLTEGNAAAVASICSRLDGLPLAIELAAARTLVLSPDEILVRLRSRLKLLKDGPRGTPARQQTLRGTIDWSYDLLDDSERRMFAQLAVFVDGCDVGAIEAICAPGGDPETDVMDVLTSLVEKSLVSASEPSHGGGRRLIMLQTLREYASERLLRDPTHVHTRDKHARHYSQLARETGRHLQRMEGRAWSDQLEQDHGNLCAALEWLVQRNLSEEAYSLIEGMWRFWVKRGRLREGTALTRDAIERLGTCRSAAWAGAMIGLGELYRAQGDLTRAREIKEATFEYLSEANPVRAAVTLTDLGHIAQDEGRLDDAFTLHSSALEAHRDGADPRLIAHALMGIARLSLATGNLQESRVHYAYIRQVGLDFGEAEHINEGIIGLAEVARRNGDLAASQELFAEGLTFGLRMGDIQFAFDAVSGMAYVALQGGDALRATHLLGAAEAIQARTGLVPYFPDEREQSLGRTRLALGDEEHTAAYTAGRSMSLEEAVGYALLQ